MARTKKLTPAAAFRLLANDFRKATHVYKENWGNSPSKFCYFSFQEKARYFERNGICSGIGALLDEKLITPQTEEKMKVVLRKEFANRTEDVLDYYWPLPVVGKVDPVRAVACDYLATLCEKGK